MPALSIAKMTKEGNSFLNKLLFLIMNISLLFHSSFLNFWKITLVVELRLVMQTLSDSSFHCNTVK